MTAMDVVDCESGCRQVNIDGGWVSMIVRVDVDNRSRQ